MFLLPFLVIVLDCFCKPFPLLSSFPLFSCDLMANFSVMFEFLFLYLCVCICCIGLAKVFIWICLKTWMNSLANPIDFWFQVTMRFWYSSLYINKVASSCWSFNSKCISNILRFCSPLSQLLLFLLYLCANDFTPFQYSGRNVELDHNVGWASNNWCFQTVVLEKTLESPLDIKEIKPVNPKGNQLIGGEWRGNS